MKNSVTAAVALVLIGSLVAGCAQQAATAAARPDEAAIRSAIEAQQAKMAAAIVKNDGKTVASFFADDATWILADASTTHGKADIEKGMMASTPSLDSVTNLTQTIDKLIVASDSEAVTFTTIKATAWKKGKKTGEAVVNPFADAWKKGPDGTWRITYEVNAQGTAKRP